MKIGIILLARISSSRLPGKILKPINGKPLARYILERIKPLNMETILATSNDTSDDKLADFFENEGLKTYRGDLHNVAIRFLNCAKKHNLDYAIRINGDNLFVDTETLKEMIAHTNNTRPDFLSNVPGRTFGFGNSIEIVRTSFFESTIYKSVEKNYSEHVTLHLYDHFMSRISVFENTKCIEIKGQNFAVDTPEDFDKAEKILKHMTKSHTLYDICKIAKLMNDVLEG